MIDFGVDFGSFWAWLLGAPLRVVLTIVGAVVAQIVITKLINRAIARSISNRATQIDRREAARNLNGEGSAILLAERHEQRASAIGHLLRSIATIIIWSIALTMVLTELHVDIGPLLASAGIVGIAVGFGAQSLIKDYFSGISLILEDQFGVGDVVDVDGIAGTVEEVTLRVTRLRDASGVVWYVRNGEILTVANMSQGWTMATVDIPVAASADLREVKHIVDTCGDTLFNDADRGSMLVSAPKYVGVEGVNGDYSTVRIVARTEPGLEAAGARAIREAAKQALDAAGIAMPTAGALNQPDPSRPKNS